MGKAVLTGIDDEVLGVLMGNPQTQMFTEMFYRNYSMTGESAKTGGQYFYEVWPSATSAQVGKMYSDDTGLADWGMIPSDWK